MASINCEYIHVVPLMPTRTVGHILPEINRTGEVKSDYTLMELHVQLFISNFSFFYLENLKKLDHVKVLKINSL